MLYNNLSSRTLVRDLMSLSVKPREILTSVRDESSTCCKRNIYLKNSQKKTLSNLQSLLISTNYLNFGPVTQITKDFLTPLVTGATR